MNTTTSVPGLAVASDYDQRHDTVDDCPPHNCDSQCDDCHTHENCVPGTRLFGELLLCDTCWSRRN